MMARALAALLLAVALGGIALFLRGDRRRWRSFNGLTDTRERQRRYRRWAWRLWQCFALPAIGGLVVLGRSDALTVLPIELRTIAVDLPAVTPLSLLTGMVGGAMIGVAILIVRGGKALGQVGDTAAMLPRNRAELALAAWLSISAGVSEEIAFRLFLPLLIAILSGSAVAGMVLAVALFGAVHLYQGRAGVIASMLIGAVLTFCYLATGALWLAVLFHIVIDLAGLVVRPALAGAWRT